MKEAKITAFRWHDQRHDFASQLILKGVDIYVVKELLGHASVVTTEVYAHLAPSLKIAAVELLDGTEANIVEFTAKGQKG